MSKLYSVTQEEFEILSFACGKAIQALENRTLEFGIKKVLHDIKKRHSEQEKQACNKLVNQGKEQIKNGEVKDSQEFLDSL